MSISRPPFRVVLADDHPIVLSGLNSLIQLDPGFQVVQTCPDGPSALAAIRDTRPDLAILDIMMPGLTGLEVLAALRAEQIETRVVILTASARDDHIVQVVADGAF